MFCIYCGTEIPDHSKYCLECGKPVPIKVQLVKTKPKQKQGDNQIKQVSIYWPETNQFFSGKNFIEVCIDSSTAKPVFNGKSTSYSVPIGTHLFTFYAYSTWGTLKHSITLDIQYHMIITLNYTGQKLNVKSEKA